MSMTFRCPVKHCYYYVAVKNQEHYDRVAESHGCPYAGGTTTFGPEYTVSILSDVWDSLDIVVAKIIENPQGHDTEYNKAYAAGISSVLCVFMRPHFSTVEEISREALKRYKNKKAGFEYDTPGIKSQKYVIPTDWSNNAATARTAPARTATQQVRQLNEKQINGIRNGKGSFEAKEVAMMYQIPVAEVERIWNE